MTDQQEKLKSAEEWVKEQYLKEHCDVADIKQIQLNAHKAGIRRAAEMFSREYSNAAREGCDPLACYDIAITEVRTLADSITEKEMEK